jgi:hypothetical protein
MNDKTLKLYSHTPLIYWWPVWLSALGLGFWTYLGGTSISVGERTITVLESSVPGFSFLLLTLVTIYVSTVRLRGIKSAILIAFVAVIFLILALTGIIDNIFAAIPTVATWISAGTYLWLGGGLFFLWAIQTLLIDRMVYYRVTPGQITKVKVIGGAKRTYDARGLAIDHASDDFLRHFIFGAGAGDVTLKTSGASSQTLEIYNVLNVSQKIKTLQKLSNVEPDTVEKN